MKKKSFFVVLMVFALLAMMPFSAFAQGEAAITACQITGGEQVEVTYQITGEAACDDGQVYLFALKTYEANIGSRTDYLSSAALDAGRVQAPLNKGSKDSLLFSRMVLAVKQEGKFVEISNSMYLTNPEAAASYQEPVPYVASKKGLLVNDAQLADVKELGTKQAVVNLPISQLMSKSRGEVSYQYNGKTYYFNIGGMDRLIGQLSQAGLRVTVIVLNPWNGAVPELYYPGVTDTGGINDYGFNGATQEGEETLEAIATFLAERYSGTGSARVSNWIIGNEVDLQEWNFFGAGMDLAGYTQAYEQGFRIFYNAIRSSSANARVDVPFSFGWNMVDPNRTYPNFAVRDFLSAWNGLIQQHGNIDWGVAYHPYPPVYTEPEFWLDEIYAQNTPDSRVVNFNNLSVLTDFMQAPEMRTASGQVRHILLSEAGFTSQSATRGNVEQEQAAAYAYAYYIAESNPYIDGFFLNRQVDNLYSQQQGYYFGLWNNDMASGTVEVPSSKKPVWYVFQAIDTDRSLEVSEFAKNIIGISKWSDVIPGFSRAE